MGRQKNTTGKSFPIRVLIRGAMAGLIAVFLLSLLAMWVFPNLTDPTSESATRYLVWAAVYASSAGFGIFEGYKSWKNYKTEDTQSADWEDRP